MVGRKIKQTKDERTHLVQRVDHVDAFVMNGVVITKSVKERLSHMFVELLVSVRLRSKSDFHVGEERRHQVRAPLGTDVVQHVVDGLFREEAVRAQLRGREVMQRVFHDGDVPALARRIQQRGETRTQVLGVGRVPPGRLYVG